MNILETITAHKRREVEAAKKQTTIAELEKMPHFAKQTHSLVARLTNKDNWGIIAEFKRKSPSKGTIQPNAEIGVVANAYANYGAAAISVLTDTNFFGGSLHDLSKISHLPLPFLRKDFIIDAYQIYEAKAYGASLILLIAACLTPPEVKALAKLAKSLGLEVLIEVHNKQELDHVCPEVDIVGVNNRNLKTFEVSLETSKELIEDILSYRKCAISESGISSPETILSLKAIGYSGFLIGEHFMKQENPDTAFQHFINQLNKSIV